METYPNEIDALNAAADSRIVTEVQRALGQRLALGAKRLHQGVEVPVTASGLY